MRVAFYAPLKPPNHTTPSGDREIARNLLHAFAFMGAEVEVASALRSRDGAGDHAVQQRLLDAAQRQIPNLIARGSAAQWQVWVTYHNYYKAPDLLGPAVSKALGIPYVQIESTRARKRLTGPWATFASCAEAASDAASMIFYFTRHDAEALERDAPAGQHLRHLPPFLPWEQLPPCAEGAGPMLAVGMMRPGDKVASYQIIAQALAGLSGVDWRLDLVGDGTAQQEVAAMMVPFGQQVRMRGMIPPADMSRVYQGASCLFWPGVNEAFGLSYLEAQAHGLPVIAQDRPGVRDVLAPGNYPPPEDGPGALARIAQTFLTDPDQRTALGLAAREYVQAVHLLPAAASRLQSGLRELGLGT